MLRALVGPPPTAKQLEDERNLKWLKTEKHWHNRVGKGWQAKKILGRGGQGLVGHWSYEASNRKNKALKDVVVKQSVDLTFDGILLGGLSQEAAALSHLSRTGSPHVVRMYRRLCVEQGQGSMEFDYGRVHRIFLEFCPGGDLNAWIKRKVKDEADITEDEMWAIFHCLARGTLVMHAGTEDANVDPWDREFVHFDIKPQNILIGDVMTDAEHRDMPVFKFGDFGLAIDAAPSQDDRYQQSYAHGGTWPWLTPEQLRKTSEHPWYRRPWGNTLQNVNCRYDSHTNVWQIGMLMWCLKHRCREPDWWNGTSDGRIRTFQSKLSSRLQLGGRTLGTKDDMDEESRADLAAYSIGLRALINECLLIIPQNRPTPATLLARTGRGLDTLRMTAGMLLNPPANSPPTWQPRLSERWELGPRMPTRYNLGDEHVPSPSQLHKRHERLEMARQERKERLARHTQAGMVADMATHNQAQRTTAAASGYFGAMKGHIQAGIQAGKQVQQGIRLGIQVGLQVQEGINAGVNRVAAALNAAHGGAEALEEWEIPSQEAAGGEGGNPPTAAAANYGLVPILELPCFVDEIYVGKPRNTTYRVNGLYTRTTFLQLKMKLKEMGATIPVHKMKVYKGANVFDNMQLLGDLNGLVGTWYVRVTEA